MRKLDRENRSLNFIESKVSPDHLVEVLRLHSSLRIDIDKERCRADPCDAAGGGEEAVRSCYHGISSTDSESHQYGKECVRARGDTYGKLRAGVTADRVLKFFNFRPENKSVGAQNVVDLLANQCRQGAMLFAQVEKGYTHRGRMAVSFCC